MSRPTAPAVLGAVERVQAIPGHARALRVLVIGDPEATTCRALRDAGHDVACCPDLQVGWSGAPHSGVVYSRVVDLVADDTRFDAAVAVDGWQRVLESNPAGQVEALVDWLRQHATVVLMEAARRVLAPDLNRLGPFRVLELMGGFTYLAEALDEDGNDGLDAPVVLASDTWLLADSTWIDGADVTWIHDDAADARLKPVRTFRVPGERIVKVECTSEDYFDRTQVLSEAAFLRAAGPDRRAALTLPRVHSLARGRSVMTLVRDDVPGDAGDGRGVDERLSGIVDACSRYAAEGLFHNDVRPWNVVWHSDSGRLVDFADTSAHDDDVRDLPQVLALAGTLAAVATREVRGGEHFHGDVLAIAAAAGLLDRWPLGTQLGAPWLSVSRVNVRRDVHAGMDAGGIMRAVLEETVG